MVKYKDKDGNIITIEDAEIVTDTEGSENDKKTPNDEGLSEGKYSIDEIANTVKDMKTIVDKLVSDGSDMKKSLDELKIAYTKDFFEGRADSDNGDEGNGDIDISKEYTVEKLKDLY